MIAYFRSFHRQTPILIYLPYYLYYLIRNSPTRYLSLRSKRYQSSYCGKVRAGAKKKGIFFLLLSQLSRQTRTETLATQALIIFAIVLISGVSRGGTRGARLPLFLDQTEARRAEKIYF